MPKNSKFTYVIYIDATPKKLWDALTQPKAERKYWFGMWQELAWKKGASWRLVFGKGKVADMGTVLEVKKNKRLVLKWRNECMPDMKTEGYTRCTLEIAKGMGVTKLTVTHEIARANSKFIECVAEGWPMILSSLKTMLETGASLKETRKTPEGM